MSFQFKHRKIVLDWILKISLEFEIDIRTILDAITLIDNYILKFPIKIKKLQRIATRCLYYCSILYYNPKICEALLETDLSQITLKDEKAINANIKQLNVSKSSIIDIIFQKYKTYNKRKEIVKKYLYTIIHDKTYYNKTIFIDMKFSQKIEYEITRKTLLTKRVKLSNDLDYNILSLNRSDNSIIKKIQLNNDILCLKEDVDGRDIIENEVYFTKRIDSEYVVKILYTGYEYNKIVTKSSNSCKKFYIMKWYKYSLKDMYLYNRLFINQNIISIIEQLFIGLKHIHSNNIVHGDINPKNIMIDKNDDSSNKCKIVYIDFGFAYNDGDKIGDISCKSNYNIPEYSYSNNVLKHEIVVTKKYDIW